MRDDAMDEKIWQTVENWNTKLLNLPWSHKIHTWIWWWIPHSSNSSLNPQFWDSRVTWPFLFHLTSLLLSFSTSRLIILILRAPRRLKSSADALLSTLVTVSFPLDTLVDVKLSEHGKRRLEQILFQIIHHMMGVGWVDIVTSETLLTEKRKELMKVH